MAVGEFELINDYFSDAGSRRADTLLAVGDDCALLAVPPGAELLCTSAAATPHEHADGPALAASLLESCTQLAATQGELRWALLSLTLSSTEQPWIGPFAAALAVGLEARGMQLVGGDTTRGDDLAELTCLGVRSG